MEADLLRRRLEHFLDVTPVYEVIEERLQIIGAAVVEPLPDLKIEITALRTYTQTHQEYYRYSDTLGKFVSYSPMDNGSFTMSYLMIGTSFTKDGEKAVSPLFEKMEAYRFQIDKDIRPGIHRQQEK